MTDHHLDLEMDGRASEQRILQLHVRQQQDGPARSFLMPSTSTSGKKGIFCLVKQAKITYELLSGGKQHRLAYELPQQKQKFTCMVGVNPIVITQQSGETSGCIHCSCESPECIYSLLKTLCGLRNLLPTN
uniref:E3B2 14.4k n=1 Tax=Human adenovirus D serotype 8 TaxID=31545 RepID=Q7TBG6_ADE08|nr:E3B2 14.4k [Human adenovirus D8]